MTTIYDQFSACATTDGGHLEDCECRPLVQLDRWWSLADDEDGDLVTLTDGRLAHIVLHYDNRDAITGSHVLCAPPAQQYGYRLRQWISWGRLMAELAAAPCEGCGVAPRAQCTCPF